MVKNINRFTMKIFASLIVLAIAVLGTMSQVQANGPWWGGIFKPVSSEAKAITGTLELSPDYIFFIFGKDVGLGWRELSCNSKTCLFQIIKPKHVKLKNGKALCKGSKPARFIRVNRAGGRKYKVFYLTSKSPKSACLTAIYRQ